MGQFVRDHTVKKCVCRNGGEWRILEADFSKSLGWNNQQFAGLASKTCDAIRLIRIDHVRDDDLNRRKELQTTFIHAIEESTR